MTLLVILLAIVLMQIWAYRNPLHQDQWLFTFAKNTAAALPIRLYPFVHLALAFVVALVASLVIAWVAQISRFLAFPLVLVALVYACGRKNFTDALHDYFIAEKHQDSEAKSNTYQTLLACSQLASDSGNSSTLSNEAAPLVETGETESTLAPQTLPADANEKVFDELAVRGFERYFTAIFWFVIGGVFLCVLYRVVALLAEYEAGQHQRGESDKPVADTTLTQRAQRLMAWPASRLLHLSFLLAGNFRKAYDDVLESLASTTAAFITVPKIAREAGDFGEIEADDFIALKSLMKVCLGIWLALIAIIVIQ